MTNQWYAPACFFQRDAFRSVARHLVAGAIVRPAAQAFRRTPLSIALQLRLLPIGGAGLPWRRALRLARRASLHAGVKGNIVAVATHRRAAIACRLVVCATARLFLSYLTLISIHQAEVTYNHLLQLLRTFTISVRRLA